MVTDYSQKEKAVVATPIFKMKMQQTVERIEKSTSRTLVGLR